MSEQTAAPAAEKPKVASLGRVERVNNFTAPASTPAEEVKTDKVEDGNDGNITAGGENNNDGQQVGGENNDNKAAEVISKPLSEYTKEEIEARFKELNPERVELTEEQKVAKEKEKDEKRLQLYLKNGGKVEDYVGLKQVLDSDLTELSKAELTRELKALNFDDETIAEMQRERYYQLNPDELEQSDDETDEEFEKRKAKIKAKVEFGSNKLTNRSAHLKDKAKYILDNLDKAIEAEELQKQDEVKFIAKINEVSKTLPRKLNIPLGKLNNEDLGTVDIDVQETSIAEITEQLKDASQRNKILYTEEGDLNVERISTLLLKEKLFDAGTREGFLSGRNDQIEKFKKVFPYRDAKDLGVGGGATPNGGSQKKVAGFGASQRVR